MIPHDPLEAFGRILNLVASCGQLPTLRHLHLPDRHLLVVENTAHIAAHIVHSPDGEVTLRFTPIVSSDAGNRLIITASGMLGVTDPPGYVTVADLARVEFRPTGLYLP